jgi:hypothetical protein
MADTSQRPHLSIRPSPEHLRQLPTLGVRTPDTDGEDIREYCRTHGVDYQLDLKLETVAHRYWLCTRCVGEGFTAWREGVVLMENAKPNGAGEHEMIPYGPDDLKIGQRLDYFRILTQELDRLLEHPESPEVDKRIQEVRREINKVMPRSNCQ